MATKRCLIDYLPPFIQDFREIRHIVSAEQQEVDGLWKACEDVLSDQFVMSATENGVKRWEKVMGIAPKDTDTLDERKFKILTTMNQELPYTLNKLKETLTTICGERNFSINLQSADYRIEVKLALTNKNNYQEVVELLINMIPANMTQWVQIMYNQHETFNQFTHTEMTAHTHEQLRNEVLTNG